MKRRTIQILGAIGIGCAIAGGWFALSRDYLIAIPLWIIAGAIIMVQKRKRNR
ncbi:MAG: hypothetical protein QXU32_10440 [Nitrososphaerales archaeon]